MKYILSNLFITVLMIFSNSNAAISQVAFPINEKTNDVEFVNIIELDTIEKNEVYRNSHLWVVDVFKSSNDVIQYADIENGKIVGKGNFAINSTGLGAGGTIHKSQAGVIKFTFEVSAKENKCRLRIYDLVHKARNSGGKISNDKPDCGGMGMYKKTWNSIQQQALDKTNSLLLSYENFMKSIASNSTDDW